MVDWLRTSFTNNEQVPWDVVSARAALAMVLGFVVAEVYYLSRERKRDDGGTLPTTLALLCVLIALVTMVIGDSVARAFGLVGALSIVRFRTVVEDTRDTAFVIFAVVIGMAVGSGHALLAAIGIPAVAGMALAMRQLGARPSGNVSANATVIVRVGLGLDPDKLLGDVFRMHLEHFRLTGAATARQGAALEVTYSVRLKRAENALAFVGELNRTDGVQNVELRSQN